jgi:uncharacterized membrane protein
MIIVQGITGIIIQIIRAKKEEKVWRITAKKDICFLIFAGILSYFAALLNPLALIEGDVAIVYKVISYSLFIPIIFSIIYYKEKVT